MALKRLANYLEFLRKGYYRRGNQVKDLKKKILKINLISKAIVYHLLLLL